MRPLNIELISWNDFVANTIFFVLDIVLLSVLVPIFVRRYDAIKWRPARQKLAERSALHLNMFEFYVENFLKDIEGFLDALLSNTQSNNEDKRRAFIGFFGQKLMDYQSKFKELNFEYFQSIQILNSAFDANLSINAMSFYESISRSMNITMAALFLWAARMNHSNGTLEFVVTEAMLSSNDETEKALRDLCISASLRFDTHNNRILIPFINQNIKRSSNYSYPTNKNIKYSLKKISSMLSSTLNDTLSVSDISAKSS